MKLSLENLDTAPVTEDISDADVLEMIAQSEAVSELTLSIENLLFNGEKLDEVSGNIYGVITMLEKEALTKASFEFLNMDGALSAVVGRQLEFTEATRQAITTEAMAGLKDSVKKGYEAVIRWFKALWDWVVQLLRKAIDMFIGNKKILERMKGYVKGGKFYGAPAMKVSGVNVAEFATKFDDFVKDAVALEAKADIKDDEVAGLGNKLNAMIAGVKEGVSAESLGWTSADKVDGVIGKAIVFCDVIKAKGTDNKNIKEAMKKAIDALKAGDKKEGAELTKLKEDVAAAKKVASLHAKVVALRVRGLKFAVAQAIAMGRHYRKGEAAAAPAAEAKA